MFDWRVGLRTDRPASIDCIVIKLPALKRRGMLKCHHMTRGTFGNLAVVSDIECLEPRPCLKITGWAFGRQIDQRVLLESVPMRLGGVRWYARCPLTGKRCTTLVLPPDATQFASMPGWDVSYFSQRLDPFGRKFLALEKAEERLEGASKYTRKPTRRRLQDDVCRLERELEEMMCGDCSIG